ncbi:MAG: FAD-dependent oxidoreductase [Flavobacteriaceae bacterium]
MKVAIIGAGPCALSAAYELSRNGIEVDLYEKSNVVGGLSKSIEIWGTSVEIGPHFLVKNEYPEVAQLLCELSKKDDVLEFERLTRIYWNDFFLKYPPKILDLLKNIGLFNTLKLTTSLIKQKIFNKKSDGSLESYVKEKMGAFIFNYFFKGYTEKLWGVDCKQINEDYAKGLIGVGNTSIISLIQRFLIKSDVRASKTCVYPIEGMSFFWKKLQKSIESNKGQFFFSSPPSQFIVHNNQITGLTLSDNLVRNYDYIISTIPESILLKLLGNTPNELMQDINSIKYRNVICVYLLINQTDFIKENNLYIYDKKIKCVRITNYNRFRNKKNNQILMMEYWVNSNDHLWNCTEDDIQKIVQKDITFLPKAHKVFIKDYRIIKLENAYQIPNMELNKTLTKIDNHLSSFSNLLRSGRANQSKFNYGMSGAISDGIKTARKIIEIKKSM